MGGVGAGCGALPESEADIQGRGVEPWRGTQAGAGFGWEILKLNTKELSSETLTLVSMGSKRTDGFRKDVSASVPRAKLSRTASATCKFS